MGIVMPMYTFGIICFFVYTLMKLVSWYFMVNVTCDYVYSCLCILFKKPADEISPPVKPQPILKDLIDPDHRKYGAYSSSEDAYPNGSERSKKVVDDYKQKEDANRRKASAGAAAGKSDTFKGRLERETVSQEEDYSKDDDGDDEKSEIHNTDSWSPNETTTSSSYEPSSSSMEQDTMILAATKKAVPPTLTVQPPTPSTPPVASEIFVEPQKIPEVATIIEHDDNKTTTTTTPGDDKTDFFVDNPPQNPSDERLTPEQLTSAALFFDETIEISDADFEHVSCPTGKLDASRHDGQQEDKIDDELSPVISATPPSPQLVEYAGSLANRILADATSDASSPAQVVTQDVLLTKPGVSDNNVSIPAAGESSRKEDVCSQESHPGARDRDAIVKAVQGILDQVSALGQQASKIETDELTKISQKNEESRSSSKPEKEVDLEQPKGSIKEENKKSEEKAKLEPERKSSVKRHPSAEKEVTFQLPEAKKPEVEDDEEEEEVEEEEEEEEEPVRPPTPPRHGGSKKSKHNQHLSPSTTTTTNESTTNHTPVLVPPELILFAQQLSSHIIQQSAAAAIALAKQASSPQSQQHREILSVLGIEETAEMESGEKWDDRTPTPTFRMATPPVPHRAPSPPEDIPSIFLEGPLPMAGQQLMVSDSQVEMEGGDYGDDYENNTAPIILSGKVTLSVISGGGGAPDEITDASSLSYDDKGKNKNKTAIKAEKGLSNARKTPASTSHKEYEDIKKAEADNDGQNNKEDTEGDISVMGKIEELPKDEE
ncbi:nucleolar and coiled-body phosphoprotein 1 isoform X3 [Folsomia candida]|uniref:nucleolar and coiled-body phosphoprotein 1 isoform X3 n=1 Tax=Folsomia candida TaxID=158441 RepID=UPI001605508A|nr:nucleolar and coiled-body phosphoprotein 1 isoform X3 [Folsomia candida]